MNATDKSVKVYTNSIAATCEAVTILNDSVCSQELSTEDIPEHLSSLYTSSCVHLNENQRERLRALLLMNQSVFAKYKWDIGRTDVVTHKIITQNTDPIRQKPRRLPFAQRSELASQIDNMLCSDIIEPSESPWSPPLVLVRKKDGSTRICLDYRKLNDITKKDSFPVSRIDDKLDALSGAEWFHVLDLQSGYFQVKCDENDREKTAFVTENGLYQFKVMPMGLCNAPATFERLMNKVLKGLSWKTCLVYLDDIIVFGTEFESTLQRLHEVFDRLRMAGLKLNPKKCTLFQKSVNYLGHVVSKDGVRADSSKTEAISNWPRPTTVKEVRAFRGICLYYRRFIFDFAKYARPLNKLTEKQTLFEWTDICEEAFNIMKSKLYSPPILAYPDPSGLEFILNTDCSNSALGAVISQNQNGHEKVIAYYSRALSKSEINYCTTRKELLAVISSIKHFHCYLYGRKFTVRTDHSSLRWITKFKDIQGQLARWLEVLGTYDFEIVHRPGLKHSNADSLSRRPCLDCSHCEKVELKYGVSSTQCNLLAIINLMCQIQIVGLMDYLIVK